MNIAVIGATGMMGTGITTQLAKAGHTLTITGNNQAKLEALKRDIDLGEPKGRISIAASAKAAAAASDVSILTVWYPEPQATIATELGDAVTGKIVVNIANPFNKTYSGLTTPVGTSAAEELSQQLPEAKIVKAWNTVMAYRFGDPELQGMPVDCFVAGDDQAAVATVMTLVKDTGLNPVNTGGLAASRTLEAMMLVMVAAAQQEPYKQGAGWKILHK